ncbi:hypothetical protein L249_0429, partial [Ophiocordyceps polyrhachis-furcata BCC 54312]
VEKGEGYENKANQGKPGRGKKDDEEEEGKQRKKGGGPFSKLAWLVGEASSCLVGSGTKEAQNPSSKGRAIFTHTPPPFLFTLPPRDLLRTKEEACPAEGRVISSSHLLLSPSPLPLLRLSQHPPTTHILTTYSFFPPCSASLCPPLPISPTRNKTEKMQLLSLSGIGRKRREQGHDRKERLVPPPYPRRQLDLLMSPPTSSPDALVVEPIFTAATELSSLPRRVKHMEHPISCPYLYINMQCCPPPLRLTPIKPPRQWKAWAVNPPPDPHPAAHVVRLLKVHQAIQHPMLRIEEVVARVAVVDSNHAVGTSDAGGKV